MLSTATNSLAICKEISIKFSLLASLTQKCRHFIDQTQKYRHFIDQTFVTQVFDHCCRRRHQLNESALMTARHFQASNECFLSPSKVY